MSTQNDNEDSEISLHLNCPNRLPPLPPAYESLHHPPHQQPAVYSATPPPYSARPPAYSASYPEQHNVCPSQGTAAYSTPPQQEDYVDAREGLLTCKEAVGRYMCPHCYNATPIFTKTPPPFIRCPRCKGACASSKKALYKAVAPYIAVGFFFVMAGIGLTIGRAVAGSFDWDTDGIGIGMAGTFSVGFSGLVRGFYLLAIIKTGFRLE